MRPAPGKCLLLTVVTTGLRLQQPVQMLPADCRAFTDDYKLSLGLASTASAVPACLPACADSKPTDKACVSQPSVPVMPPRLCRMYSELISAAIATGGPHASKTTAVKLMRRWGMGGSSGGGVCVCCVCLCVFF